MRLRRRRAVGAFGDDLRPDARRVVHRDLIFERGGNEDVDVEREQLIVVERLAAGEAVDGLVLLGEVEHLRDVEPVVVVDAALPVGDGDDLARRSATADRPRPTRRCRSPAPRRARP